MTDPKTESLIDAIDDAAIKLLKRTSGDASLTGDESALFIEQVKGFEAVVKWASVRGPLLPKESEQPQETKFAGLKRKFSAADPEVKRRRGRPPSAAKGNSDRGIDLGPEPDDGDNGAPADDDDWAAPP